jgi:hypothetical protein
LDSLVHQFIETRGDLQATRRMRLDRAGNMVPLANALEKWGVPAAKDE